MCHWPVLYTLVYVPQSTAYPSVSPHVGFLHPLAPLSTPPSTPLSGAWCVSLPWRPWHTAAGVCGAAPWTALCAWPPYMAVHKSERGGHGRLQSRRRPAKVRAGCVGELFERTVLFVSVALGCPVLSCSCVLTYIYCAELCLCAYLYCADLACYTAVLPAEAVRKHGWRRALLLRSYDAALHAAFAAVRIYVLLCCAAWPLRIWLLAHLAFRSCMS